MGYREIHRESIEAPERFWRREAEKLDWFEPPQEILSQDEKGFYRWFKGASSTSATWP